ncbi:hypothetical protein [Cupriavidus sp. 8B]
MTVGAASDLLKASGTAAPPTHVLLAADVLAIASALFFALAARAACKQPAIDIQLIQTTR